MEERRAVRFRREGTGAFAPVIVSQSAYSQTQHDTSDASPPLFLLLTCLQVSVSAAWAAHVKLKVNSVTQAPLAKHPILSPSPASIRTP